MTNHFLLFFNYERTFIICLFQSFIPLPWPFAGASLNFSRAPYTANKAAAAAWCAQPNQLAYSSHKRTEQIALPYVCDKLCAIHQTKW